MKNTPPVSLGFKPVPVHSAVSATIVMVALVFSTMNPVSAQDEFRIKDPSFEGAKAIAPDCWVPHPGVDPAKGTTVELVSDACDGSQAVKITAGSGPVDNQWILQDILPPKKDKWVLRFRAKGSGQGMVYLIYYGEGTEATRADSEIKFTATEKYESYDLPIEIPPEAKRLRLHLGALRPNSEIIFDHVEVLNPSDASRSKGAAPKSEK